MITPTERARHVRMQRAGALSGDQINTLEQAAAKLEADGDEHRIASSIRAVIAEFRQPASAAVADGLALLPEWAASILQPGNWRDVHPGYPGKKLSVTYAKGDWELMMAQLAAAPGVKANAEDR